jgi:hypothetical protein
MTSCTTFTALVPNTQQNVEIIKIIQEVLEVWRSYSPGIHDIGCLPRIVINVDSIIIQNKSNIIFQHNTAP